MELPYCTIDGKEFQLYVDESGVYRFPDDGREIDDLNSFMCDYFRGTRPFSEVLDYYLNNGCSYHLVEGYFSHYGINNHNVTQGNASPMHFILYYKDGTIEDGGNPEKDREEVIENWANIAKDMLGEYLNNYIKNADIEVVLSMAEWFEKINKTEE